MKKLCLALLVISGVAFADQCAEPAQKVISKLQKFNKTSVTINYSSDKADFANMCKADIVALNSAITVNMNPVSGTNQFKFSK